MIRAYNVVAREEIEVVGTMKPLVYLPELLECGERGQGSQGVFPGLRGGGLVLALRSLVEPKDVRPCKGVLLHNNKYEYSLPEPPCELLQRTQHIFKIRTFFK